MNLFELTNPPHRPYSHGGLQYLGPVIVLMIVGFIMILSASIEDFEPSPPVQLLSTSEYKETHIPSSGTVRLVGGEARVIHENIKRDSVIMLSRKSVEGVVGGVLVVHEIVPNEYFIVRSLNGTEVESGDFGEVYFCVF